jgi:hypothetical protein
MEAGFRSFLGLSLTNPPEHSLKSTRRTLRHQTCPWENYPHAQVSLGKSWLPIAGSRPHPEQRLSLLHDPQNPYGAFHPGATGLFLTANIPESDLSLAWFHGSLTVRSL